MNNLTQNQTDAKQAYLDNQQAQMIARYEKADKNERAAIIRQIDSFLPIIKGDEKSFWLKFRQKLERLSENYVK
jgi:hypothetical protein